MFPRLRAYLVTLPLLAAVLLPLAWRRGRDDFPISSYPMFTHKRDEVMDIVHVLAVAANGHSRPVSPDYVANGAVMQAAATIRRAIAEGGAAALCTRVADNLPAQLRGYTRELIVATSTYNTVRYFSDATGKAPLRRLEHARCPVSPEAVPQ